MMVSILEVILLIVIFFSANANSIKLVVIFWGIIAIVKYKKLIQPISNMEQEIRYHVEELSKNEGYIPVLKGEHTIIEYMDLVIDRGIENQSRTSMAQVFDKEAELTALQSQINPHFLYNTLESIRGQAIIDGNKDIGKMIAALASFFRYSISTKGNLVTLREELNNIENYMMIQRYRFDNRFSLDIQIEEGEEEVYDYFVPRLTIQPIVENAIYHGLEECLENGKIEIDIIQTERQLIITVSDNGKGMVGETLEKINNKIHNQIEAEDIETTTTGTGIALENIHRRIRLLFGEEYGMQLYSTLGHGTDVEVILPTNFERI